MSSILIVDDQPHIRELFSQELMDEGHRVLGVGDAESVMKSISDSKPDLVLLDLYLNGLEGWDVLREIKRKDSHVPVLIVTAYDNYVDDPRLSEADGYILKSFNNIENLKKKVVEILDRKVTNHQGYF